MFELFKNTHKLEGRVEIRELPPFVGYNISLTLLPVESFEATAPFDDIVPSEANADEERIVSISLASGADTSGTLHQTFSLRRPKGWYYVQLNVELQLKNGPLIDKQSEHFFFRKRPLSIPSNGDALILLPIVWPAPAMAGQEDSSFDADPVPT